METARLAVRTCGCAEVWNRLRAALAAPRPRVDAVCRVDTGGALVLVLLLLAACSAPPEAPAVGDAPPDGPAVNLAHLDHLGQEVVRGDTVYRIVHIYAEHPDYAWVGDDDEGIACVDDAARAAVVYLRHYERTGETASRDKAQALLRFVQYMQDETGLFFNFVWDPALTINRGHPNSRADEVNWWTARAVWALGEGARVLAGEAPEAVAGYRASIDRVMPHLRALLERFGETTTDEGRVLPQWLVYGSAADATSELLLGLTALHEAFPDEGLRTMIRRFATGIAMMRYGTMQRRPYGAHASWSGGWHAWGNSQTQALARAGQLESARAEALTFYPRLLVYGWLHSIPFEEDVEPRRFEQIAYGVRPVAVGLVRLYEATGEVRYARMAGLAASWLTGDNVASAVMYEPETGRGLDGITGPDEVNRNSGAESTIEALLTLLEVGRHPEAAAWLGARGGETLTFARDGRPHAARVFTRPDGERLAVVMDLGTGRTDLVEGEAVDGVGAAP